MTTLLSLNNYHYYRGGAETVFLEHNALLESHGWNVVPFAMQHPKNLPSPWSKHFVEEIEFGSDYGLADKLRRVPKVIYSTESQRRLARVIAETRPDICHAHNIYHHLSPSVLHTLERHGIPTVLTLHDLKIACPSYSMLTHDGVCERCKGGRVYNVLVHRCIKGSAALSGIVMLEAVVHRVLGSYRRCVDLFVVPSRFYIDKLAEWGTPREKFRHVPNFVDSTRFEPRFSPGKRFLYFGRLARENGLGTLIRAAAISGTPVSIVGTGPLEQELRALAASLGADVEFRGYLSGKPLQDAVREARAVVLPSEWYENAPMSALEAYALGKPMIGARIGGIPELIRESETGAVFASGSADSLAAALKRFADSSDADIMEMGRAGRLWVEQQFSSTAYLERILAIYRELGVEQTTLGHDPGAPAIPLGAGAQ